MTHSETMIKYVPFICCVTLASVLTLAFIFPGMRGVNWETSQPLPLLVVSLLWALVVKPR